MDFENTSNQSDFFGSSTPRTSDRSAPPDEPLAAPHATQHETPDEDSICYECRQINWDILPSLARRLVGMPMTERFLIIRTIEANHEQLAASSCKICRILSRVMPRSLDQTEWNVKAQPLSNSSAYISPYDWRIDSNITTIQVCPRDKNILRETSGSKCFAAIMDGEGFRSRTIPPRFIDYHWPKLLAQSCEKDHKGLCWFDSLHHVSVSGLKVIKVSSRTVIEAPAECKYVALSYVWAKQPDVSPTLDLQRPPPLIEDTIFVTIAMGYEYLWIDRYCIPRADDQERHRMINQMGQVYSNASLTIIDASGVDAQTGLPGVSSFARRLQKSVHIRNTALFEMPCGEREVKSSKWATRGWTYQEGYFSPRRLIFTPSQVLFLCNRIYNMESIYRLSQLHRPEAFAITPKLKYLIPGVRSIVEMHTKPHLFVQLQEYSKRELTYRSDSLNAFLGVLNSDLPMSLRRLSRFLHIIWGLIVRIEDDRDRFRVYLNWYHEAPVARIPELPSWTWAGWGGPLVMPEEDEGISWPKQGNRVFHLAYFAWEISCVPEGQKPVKIRDFADFLSKAVYTDKLQQRQLTYLKQLHITCLVVPIKLEKNPLTEAECDRGAYSHVRNMGGHLLVKCLDSTTKNVAVVNLCEGVFVATAPYLDQDLDQDLEKQDDVIGLLFARKDDPESMTISCLLARPLYGGLYERVGVVPYLMVYPHTGYRKHSRARLSFLDKEGDILDGIRLTGRQWELPFDGIGERRTIVLV